MNTAVGVIETMDIDSFNSFTDVGRKQVTWIAVITFTNTGVNAVF